MAKIYCTKEEAIAKLGVSQDEFEKMVSDGKLRSYPDGARQVFKVADVEALAGGGSGGEVDLKPVGGDTVSLAEADAGKPAGKEDTVITAEGISIFDDEDLEIETADPMAKTQIAPSVEDQVLLEGIGSGSGLLDLTRESDDTSLGAEVLEHIDMEGAVGSDLTAGLEGETTAGAGAGFAPRAEVAAAPPTYVEAMDASSGFFSGLAVGLALLSLVIVSMTVAALMGRVPSYFESLQQRLLLFVFGALVVVAIFGIVGLLIGRSVQAKRQAMAQMGG